LISDRLTSKLPFFLRRSNEEAAAAEEEESDPPSLAGIPEVSSCYELLLASLSLSVLES